MVKLFLDSGAFSARTKNIEIDIDSYIAYIKRYERYIDVYANLDVIADAEATWENQEIMEAAGLHPLPVFHVEDDMKYLERCIANYDYFCLGGMAKGYNRSERASFIDLCFEQICDQESRLPKCKIHGFGMTSIDWMWRWPWYSVDSTSWVLTSRMGSVFVPRFKNGKYDYELQPWKVTVSNRSPLKREPQSDSSWHIDNFSPMKQEIIMKYFEERGFVLGTSKFRKESPDYKLKDGERWYGKEEADGVRNVGMVPTAGWSKDRIVEIVIEDGLSNNYMKRDLANMYYFADLAKAFPKWPWAWGKPRQKGLLI